MAPRPLPPQFPSHPLRNSPKTICFLFVTLNAPLCPQLGMSAACHSRKTISDTSQTKQGFGVVCSAQLLCGLLGSPAEELGRCLSLRAAVKLVLCARLCMCVGVRACKTGDQRALEGFFLSLVSIGCLNWLATELQNPVSASPARGSQACMPHFGHGFWGWNSGHHAVAQSLSDGTRAVLSWRAFTAPG